MLKPGKWTTERVAATHAINQHKKNNGMEPESRFKIVKDYKTSRPHEVSGSLALLHGYCEVSKGSRAAAPTGDKVL